MGVTAFGRSFEMHIGRVNVHFKAGVFTPPVGGGVVVVLGAGIVMVGAMPVEGPKSAVDVEQGQPSDQGRFKPM